MNYQEPEAAGRFLGSVFVDTKMEQDIWFFGKEHKGSASSFAQGFGGLAEFYREKQKLPCAGSLCKIRHRAIFPGLRPKYCNRCEA
jgi:hypothetical protein